MKKTNYVANDVVMRWLNKSVTTLNVMLQFLDIYIYIYITSNGPAQFTNNAVSCFVQSLYRMFKIFLKY